MSFTLKEGEICLPYEKAEFEKQQKWTAIGLGITQVLSSGAAGQTAGSATRFEQFLDSRS